MNMKKLYFFLNVAVILAPIPMFFLESPATWLILIAQWTIIFISWFGFKKTRKEVYKYSRPGYLKSIIFNVFASEKEKELIDKSNWTMVIDKDLKLKDEFKDENLDNKQH